MSHDFVRAYSVPKDLDLRIPDKLQRRTWSLVTRPQTHKLICCNCSAHVHQGLIRSSSMKDTANQIPDLIKQSRQVKPMGEADVTTDHTTEPANDPPNPALTTPETPGDRKTPTTLQCPATVSYHSYEKTSTHQQATELLSFGSCKAAQPQGSAIGAAQQL